MDSLTPAYGNLTGKHRTLEIMDAFLCVYLIGNVFCH
jgi:hypothetical protein